MDITYIHITCAVITAIALTIYMVFSFLNVRNAMYRKRVHYYFDLSCDHAIAATKNLENLKKLNLIESEAKAVELEEKKLKGLRADLAKFKVSMDTLRADRLMLEQAQLWMVASSDLNHQLDVRYYYNVELNSKAIAQGKQNEQV